MKKVTSKKRGMTLIEIMLYFFALTLVLFVGMTFAIQILNTSQLASNVHDVQNEREVIAALLHENIRMATSINAADSTFDDDHGRLSLQMPEPSLNPSVFYWQGNDLYFERGSEAAVRINSSFLDVDIFRVHRIVYPKSPDQVVVDAHIALRNQDVASLQQESNLHLIISLFNI